VKADSNLLQKFVGIAEESGLCCNICREGYKFQPTKVLAIYTFTMPCHVEEAEPAARKTMGYTTVSHFNLVHVDCHSAAVRQARGRDEWESALLQNANTKCNGLMPLWGPSVPESTFASCLARHNTYLSEATNHRDIGYQSTVHDLKLLLLRFAQVGLRSVEAYEQLLTFISCPQDRSFSEETGGGGPQSNMHLVPYLLHMALYVLNTTRSAAREEKNLMAFLDQPKERWIDSSYMADGPMYYTVMALLVLSPNKWKKLRVRLLQRLLLTAHLRAVTVLKR
jgi:E3 ubiquitin-protein ligase UBR4